MKKKIALLLAAIMTVSMIPATAFAVTTNEISKQVVGTTDAEFTTTANSNGVLSTTAPILTLKDKSLNETTEAVQIQLTLSNAEWNLKEWNSAGTALETIDVGDKGTLAYRPSSNYNYIDVDVLSSSTIIVTAEPSKYSSGSNYGIAIPLEVKLTGEGAATVSVDGRNSVVSNGTYQFGTVVSGATTTTIEKTVDIQETGTLIKPIVITETASGSMKDGTITMKLSNGFEFTKSSFTASVYPSAQITGGSPITFTVDSSDKAVATAKVEFVNGKSTEAVIISVNGAYVGWDENDVNTGAVAQITVSGAGITKTSLDVGTARTYSIKFTAENKTLPQFISGRRDSSDVETLKVTMAEIIENSWLESRKTTITFPEGVKIIDIVKADTKNITTVGNYNVVDNQVTLTGFSTSDSSKAELDLQFTLSISPDFTGDIIATLGGAGVETEIEAIVGTAITPVTIAADTNEVVIDYRKTAIGDIIITENVAGALEKGKTLYLEIDKIEFDGTPTVEVVEGDIKIDTVTKTDGRLAITIKTASQKTPAVLKVTDVELYLDRTIPAGSYPLSLVAGSTYSNSTGAVDGDLGTENNDNFDTSNDAYFQNSVTSGYTHKKTTLFDKRSIEIVGDFIEVVTAGRDQGDDTFTTTITVTIGSSTMTAGAQTINLDVPAYISNGYTMLPVRAVTESLSGSAIVRWDDASKTVTITFGSRVVNMVVGSNVMTINGVDVPMSAVCEITGERAFIPLRDLGYALGLNDSKINWDDATKTATLN